MSKLVRHIKWDLPGAPKQDMYCFGEANFEANQAMQEPLEKLYKYENQPDMREKVKEYISELDMEIDRCEQEAVNHSDSKIDYLEYMVRLETLVQVKSDLQSRLEELV